MQGLGLRDTSLGVGVCTFRCFAVAVKPANVRKTAERFDQTAALASIHAEVMHPA